MTISLWRLAIVPWLVGLLAVPAVAAEVQSAVPARFQGDWASGLKQCGSPTDDLRLTIGASTIRFYESAGAIKAVVTNGEHELALISELAGEGERWLDVSHFRLSDDGKTLTDVSTEPAVVRYRCPKKT